MEKEEHKMGTDDLEWTYWVEEPAFCCISLRSSPHEQIIMLSK